jgi:DNA-binding GntR family transcriptional regulator
MQLEPVSRRLLRDEAYRALLAAIVTGELEPGQLIRDADLAAQAGLSRTPVREALARLADEGLVESKPNAYTRVTRLDRRSCLEAFTVLRALHVLAVTTATPWITPADIARMRQANDRFAGALAADDIDAALAADGDVHGVAVAVADNATLAGMLERLAPRIRRLERLRFRSLPGRDSVQMHERLIAAMESGKVDEAARLEHGNWSTLGRLIDEVFADPEPSDPSTTHR